MPIFRKLTPLTSGDGQRRVRVVWGGHKFSRFVTFDEIRELIRELLELIREENEREKHHRPARPGKTRE